MTLSKTNRSLNDRNFDKVIKSEDCLVLIAFVSDWSSTCYLFDIIIEKLSKELMKHISIFKIDIEKNMKTVAAYGIKEVPSILIFKNGALIDRFDGLKSKNELESNLEGHISTL